MPVDHVYAVNAREHRPPAAGVHVFVAMRAPLHNRRRIHAEVVQILGRERRRRAYDGRLRRTTRSQNPVSVLGATDIRDCSHMSEKSF